MKKTTVLMAVSVLLLICVISPACISEADGTAYILIDNGNGETEWTAASSQSGDRLIDVMRRVNDTVAFDGMKVTVNGVTSAVTGKNTGTGSLISPGTTGNTVTSSWLLYSWDVSDKRWVAEPLSSLNDPFVQKSYALGFYPAGTVPTETPEDRSSWTMVRGDSRDTGNQTASAAAEAAAEYKWTKTRGGTAGAYSTILYAQGHVFVKYGAGGSSGASDDVAVSCYDLNGNERWTFVFKGIANYETSSSLIVGDHYYFLSGLGYIYRMNWKIGPGADGANVTSFNGAPYTPPNPDDPPDKRIYYQTAELSGKTYSTGAGSLIYDSGCIFCNASNGMVYCFDTDLALLWSYQMGGGTYYNAPTVYDGHVFIGALDGHLYILDQYTGELQCREKIFTVEQSGKEYGSVKTVSVFKKDGNYVLLMPVNDSFGMNSKTGGLARCVFNGSSIISKTVDVDSFGLTPNYFLASDTDTFRGVYFTATNGFFSVDIEGNIRCLNTELPEVHASAVMVNNERIYLTSYAPGNGHYILDTNGKITAHLEMGTLNNYNMSPITVIGGYAFVGNDDGVSCIYGQFPAYSNGSGNTSFPWTAVGVAAGIIAAIVAGTYCGFRFIGKKEHPFAFIFGSVKHYLVGEELSHNTRNKHRLVLILILGTACVLAVFLLSLCCGSSRFVSPGDALSYLFSAIGKGGANLNADETLIYSSRFPRTLAALAVGIGLSVAGAIYQAIIRNPLVDPYIMGVSSGAGTAAISVIAFEFTFFGLFSSHSPYLTAFAAIVGGLIAFGLTMLIAEKSGGSSINYVLSGVVVGLAFGAVQTLMMTMAGNKVSNVLTWLYGSFANVSWNHLWLIVIPTIAISLVPLVWAKEFNLVLLGEDQARQMGLNVRKFNRLMLILASVLTSICVAFVGVIGFVGLVVPHICRMFLGGDHRMVLPTSMAIGALLMILADFASRMILIGTELPVGAITTIIGIPVFAYLLIRKGRMYDG